MRIRSLLLSCALILLAACGPQPGAPDETATVVVGQSFGDAQEEVTNLIEDPITDAQRMTAATATEAVVAVQAAVQAALPAAIEAPPQTSLPAAATRLIVRWEVTSPAYYARRLSRPIWPGGASGVTWGIGYDGGHQTADTIRSDWAAHALAERLTEAAGVAGAPARALALSLRSVVTPFDLAKDVFTASTLPRYHAAARRALGEGFDALPENAQGSLDSTGYNRGWSMIGPNRREMREIRDTCIPAGDVQCIAAQQRSMCRLWRGTPNERGLCARREDEARTTETPA